MSDDECFAKLRATKLAFDEYLTVDGVHPRPRTIAAMTNIYDVERPEDIQNMSVEQIHDFQRRFATGLHRTRWALYKKFGLVLADGITPKEPPATRLQIRAGVRARRK